MARRVVADLKAFFVSAPLSGHGPAVLFSVARRQELIDVAVWMTVDDPGERVQLTERVDIIELAGLDH